MPDEDLVLDRDALADERVGLQLAAAADHGTGLDLDERPDSGVVADLASVEVREAVNDDAIAQAAVPDQPVRGVVHGGAGHREDPSSISRDELERVTRELEAWARARDWRGTDPYEGLNARRLAVLKRRPLGRRILIQAVKRSPLDLRPLLGIEPRHNPAAIGHALSGYARMANLDPGIRGAQIDRLLALLDELRATGYEQPCWAYPFDVETRVFFYPRTMPNTIATAFCGFGLLDVGEATGNRRALALAEGVGEFFLHRIPQTPVGRGAYFGYFPGDRTEIHNASMLASGLLARLGAAFDRSDFAEAAGRGAVYAVEHQRADGSWPYGERSDLRWVDNHHTGYVLDSLLRCAELGGRRITSAYDRGLRFYRRRLFADGGVPRFFADRTYPIDSQCAAQAVSTLALARDRDPGAQQHAGQVASFAVRRMRRGDGAFRFQRGRLLTIPAAHMRWTQAPVFDALTLLSLSLAREGNR
jgi:hypothetical protein